MSKIDKDFKAVSEYYDNIFYHDSEKVKPSISKHISKLAQRFVTRDMHVLDIACGVGDFLVASHQRGASTNGIDISEKAINICRQRVPDGNFHIGVAENLPFADKVYDLVVCLGSLEHFLDKNKSIKEMLRVAKSDARIIILVPNSDFLTRKLGLFKGTDQVSIMEEVKTLSEWQNLFNEAGLEIIDRWKDLHVLSIRWITQRGLKGIPIRLLQAVLLAVWPLKWQYQVYYLCRPADFNT